MILYHRTKLGKIKFLDITTKGATLITTWGMLDGKTQTVKKICKKLNVGKSNETSAAEQAILEMEAKIELKKKEGYARKKPSLKKETMAANLNLDKLPRGFCPSKPIGQEQCPEAVLNDETTYGQRKHNGHCLIFTAGEKTRKVHTRRMEDITASVAHLPIIKEKLNLIPKGSCITYEFVFFDKKYQKEIPENAGSVIRSKDPAKVTARYEEACKEGHFYLVPLDIIVHKHKFIGEKIHLERFEILRKIDATVPALIKDWKDVVAKLDEKKWEGLVLRTPDEQSFVTYSLDGKAHRCGAWKLKNYKEGDFFVDEVLMGKSGKHAAFYAKFHVAQYDVNGKYIDRGYVGCGELSHKRLTELKQEIDSGAVKIPFVVEIKYPNIHDYTGHLEAGQILRTREDKTADECIHIT